MVMTITTTHLLVSMKIRVAKGDPSTPKPSGYDKLSLQVEAKEGRLILKGEERALLVFGRAADLKGSGVYVSDPTHSVSAKHAYLWMNDGMLEFCDNDSTNGTTINGKAFKGAHVCARIKPDKMYMIELGAWNGNRELPVVQISLTAKEMMETPKPVAAAELTMRFPESVLPAQFYQIQVMSNDTLALFKMVGTGLVRTAAGSKIFVGRGVDMKHMRVPHLQGTTAKVSEQHGVFSARDGFLFYTDLGSTNGSFIDEKRVLPSQEYVLSKGRHVIGLAQLDYKVHPVLIEMNVEHKVPSSAAARAA